MTLLGQNTTDVRPLVSKSLSAVNGFCGYANNLGVVKFRLVL